MQKNIVVIGAGTMGNGIAHTFAQNNFKVELVDVNIKSLDKAIQTISNNLDRMVIKEKISDLKRKNTLKNITKKTKIIKRPNFSLSITNLFRARPMNQIKSSKSRLLKNILSSINGLAIYIAIASKI